MGSWQVRDAKNRFSELVEAANTNGPQTITRNGKDRAVVLSVEEYQKLTGTKMDFTTFLLSGPKDDDDDDFEIESSRDEGRFIEL